MLSDLPLLRAGIRINTQIPHPTVKVAAVNAHIFGGLANVAVEFCKFVEDELSLICVGRLAKGRKAECRSRPLAG